MGEEEWLAFLESASINESLAVMWKLSDILDNYILRLCYEEAFRRRNPVIEELTVILKQRNITENSLIFDMCGNRRVLKELFYAACRRFKELENRLKNSKEAKSVYDLGYVV